MHPYNCRCSHCSQRRMSLSAAALMFDMVNQARWWDDLISENRETCLKEQSPTASEVTQCQR